MNNRNSKILIVDDDEGVRKAFAMLLRVLQVPHDIAEDGAHGIEVMRKVAATNEPYTLIVTDHDMPRENGMAVIQEARKLFPDAEIWLASAALNDEMARKALSLGANKALFKEYVSRNLMSKFPRDISVKGELE